MSKPPPAGGPIVIDIVDFKRQNERESKDMCIALRLYLLSSFFSEANFPENADLVFVIFKNKRAKEDAERERERE